MMLMKRFAPKDLINRPPIIIEMVKPQNAGAKAILISELVR